MTAVVVVEAVALVILAVLVAGLLRSHAAILRRLHELGDPTRRPEPREVTFRPMPGMPEPSAQASAFPDGRDLQGTDLHGDAMVVSAVGTHHDTVLAFLSSGCSTCTRFWRAFADQEALHLPQGTRLVAVVKDASEESPSALADLVPPGLVVIMSSAAWADYRVPGSPYFVFVEGTTGRVRGEGTGLDWEQVASLLAQASGDLRFTMGEAGRRIGKPAADAERELELDRALLALGIQPGDPVLYQQATAPSFLADEDAGAGEGTETPSRPE